MRQFKNYFKDDFLKKQNDFKEKNLKNNQQYASSILHYVEQNKVVQKLLKETKQ